ncbi:MAG: hypothetical protein L3J65_07835 [Robiginitomaculum sp.]|nr:hypothetical protein [Robiginitomaculum sp.]
MTPDFLYTSLGLIACIGLGALSYHLHTREHNKLQPRMVPWIIITMACVATSFMLVVHLMNLFGLETGRS